MVVGFGEFHANAVRRSWEQVEQKGSFLYNICDMRNTHGGSDARLLQDCWIMICSHRSSQGGFFVSISKHWKSDSQEIKLRRIHTYGG